MRGHTHLHKNHTHTRKRPFTHYLCWSELSGQEYEFPYPLQKNDGEDEDAWAIKDAGNGRTVLKLRFIVKN